MGFAHDGEPRTGAHRLRPRRRRRPARRARGRDAARAGRARDRAGPRPRHVGRRDQRRRVRRRPDRSRASSGWRRCGRRSAAATSSAARCSGACATLARTRTHLHDNAPLRALLAGGARRPRGSRTSRVRVPVRGGEHRARRRSTGSPTGRSSTPCSPRPRCPGCCRPSRSAASTSSTAGSSTASRSAARSRSARTRIYVLHVGRLDRPLEPPRWPWEVGLVAFEIARRHRFVGDLAALPRRHRGARAADRPADPPRYTDLSQLRYRDTSRVRRAHRRRARGVGALPRRARARQPMTRPADARPARSSSRRSSLVARARAVVRRRPCWRVARRARLAARRRHARPLRVLAIAVGYAARHLAGDCSPASALWVGRRLRPARRARRACSARYYGVLRWFVGGVYRAIDALRRASTSASTSPTRRWRRSRARRGRSSC